jgi:Zn-dependent protease with chaperone function
MTATLTPSGAETLYALPGGLDPTLLSLAYRAGLLVVAVTMLVLPLIYLGIIVVTALTVWWHLTHHAWLATGSLWSLLFYAAPTVAGSFLIFFMIKPVLARPAKQVAPLPLARENQPALFHFIDEICRHVRAPIPSRIQVDCQVNASASFSSFATSFVRPRFVLTIGLPLAAGLTVRQFGGVLAHEFGHFTQGGGMRLTFVVRSINAWFARVVAERDEWDERLERWSRQADWRLSIILLLARGSVWCTRKILSGLMMAAHAISCFMLRQMEYDADSYEIKLVGSHAFVETSARMRELTVGAHLGYDDLREEWQRRTLPSDLPAFLLERSGQIPHEIVAQIRQGSEATTGYLDTHPSDNDRVRAAERANAMGGMIGGEAPASALFVDFTRLSAAATRHHYEHDLGLSLHAATFVGTDEAIQSSLGRQRRRQSAKRFYGDRLNVYRAFAIDLHAADGLDASHLIAELQTTRDAMKRSDAACSERYELFTKLANTRELALSAQALLEAGFEKVAAKDFELREGTLDEARKAEARAAEDQRRIAADLTRFESLIGRRLACAIALLGPSSPLALEAAERDDLHHEATRIVLTVNALARTWSNVNALAAQMLIESMLRANAARSPNQARAAAQYEQTIAHIRYVLERMRADLGDAPVPETSGTGATLAMVLELDRAGKPHGHAPLVVETARFVYFSALGRLAEIALLVEAAVS